MRFINIFLSKNENRIIGLDILRCLAILLVLFEHGRFLLPNSYQDKYDKFNLIRVNGVSVFFVLSGFLIGGILIKIIAQTKFDWQDLLSFWLRRWFRTVPNYLLILLVLISFGYIRSSPPDDYDLSYFVFLQNFASSHPPFFPEAWSLTVEEWFYLLFPLAFFAFNKVVKDKRSSFVISTLIFLIVPFALRIIKYYSGLGLADDQLDLEYRKIVILRLDSIMYGVIGAYFMYKWPKIWLRIRAIFTLIGVAFLIIIYFASFNLSSVYVPIFFNIESIIVLCFLPVLSSLRSTKSKIIDSLFIYISLISYSIYLLNFTFIIGYFIPNINKLIGRGATPSDEIFISNYLMFWFFTITFSTLLYYFFERPTTKLRDLVKIK